MKDLGTYAVLESNQDYGTPDLKTFEVEKLFL